MVSTQLEIRRTAFDAADGCSTGTRVPILLMFTAGLEIEINLFRKARARSIIFGIITTIVPQLVGTSYGLAFGYGIIPAIVIGSLLASHTLLTLPIITRPLALEPVVVTIGAWYRTVPNALARARPARPRPPEQERVRRYG